MRAEVFGQNARESDALELLSYEPKVAKGKPRIGVVGREGFEPPQLSRVVYSHLSSPMPSRPTEET